MYTDQFPEVTLTLCMLSASLDTIRQHFLQRGWHPERMSEAVEQAMKLDRADFVDFRVDTTNYSVPEVAGIVCARAGNWPGLG